jgi:uncharacterized protein involved in exopolysaccharide biosynthesis
MKPSNERFDADPLQVLAIDRRAVATIVLLSVVGGAIALGSSFLLPREYTATVTLLPAKSERPSALDSVAGQFGGLASLAGLDLGSDSDRSEAVATIRSRSLAVAFIEQNDLIPALFPRKWDADAKQWKVRRADDVPTINDAYRRFDRKVRAVSEDRRSGIVTLTITWRDPQRAADWANELAARVNREMRDRAISEAGSSLEYLNRELEKTQVVELRQPIYRLIEHRLRTVMLANVREQFAFRIIDPALPPDADEYSSPIRWLFALAGAALFALIGFVISVRRLAHGRNGV